MSNYQRVSQIGPDWFPTGVPDMYTQLVPITPPVSYSTLLHDSSPSTSGYFVYTTAYDVDKIRNSGYRFVKRACDGTLLYDTTPTPSPR